MHKTIRCKCVVVTPDEVELGRVLLALTPTMKVGGLAALVVDRLTLPSHSHILGYYIDSFRLYELDPVEDLIKEGDLVK